MPEIRPTVSDTGMNHGSRMGKERARPPSRYWKGVETRNSPTIRLSQAVLAQVKIQPPRIAPTMAPGRYQRTTRHSIRRHETAMRVGLAMRLAMVTTGAIVLTRMR